MKRTKRRYGRKFPPIGMKLTGTHKGLKYAAEIVKAANLKEGRGILYKGMIFATMTSAAKEITKQPVNGWRFWRF